MSCHQPQQNTTGNSPSGGFLSFNNISVIADQNAKAQGLSLPKGQYIVNAIVTVPQGTDPMSLYEKQRTIKHSSVLFKKIVLSEPKFANGGKEFVSELHLKFKTSAPLTTNQVSRNAYKLLFGQPTTNILFNNVKKLSTVSKGTIASIGLSVIVAGISLLGG